jgi:hypothetical protein
MFQVLLAVARRPFWRWSSASWSSITDRWLSSENHRASAQAPESPGPESGTCRKKWRSSGNSTFPKRSFILREYLECREKNTKVRVQFLYFKIFLFNFNILKLRPISSFAHMEEKYFNLFWKGKYLLNEYKQKIKNKICADPFARFN